MFFTVATESARARKIPIRSPFTSVSCALFIATSVPVPMAMPTSARAQGRCVVDTVAGHGNLSTGLLEVRHQALLVLRFHFTMNLFNTHLLATARAVVSPSPVAMMIFTLSALSLVTASLEVGFIGSETASNPAKTPSTAR